MLKKYFSPSTRKFIKQSQKKINAIKRHLQDLNQEEDDLEKAVKKIHKDDGKVQNMKISLSIDSVIKATVAILLVLALVYLLQIIKSIIIVFLMALFLTAAFNPAVNKMQGYKIPRGIGIIIMYILVLGVVVIMFTSLIPVIADQVTSLATSVSGMILNIVNGDAPSNWFIAKLQPIINQIWENVDQKQILTDLPNTLQDVGSKLTDFAGNAIGAIFSIFNGIFNTLLVLIITFFMVVDSKSTSNFFHSLFPARYSEYISIKSKQISERIGEWIRGQILLAVIMGLISFTVFSLIGIHYAVTLAFVSALAEFIPYLGPIITFTSAALIATNQDPMLLLWLIPIYSVLQVLEGNILIPLILGKSVGMNPVVVLFALLSGATIGVKWGGSIGLGLVGMILAVPIANIISIFVEEYTEKKK